MSSNAEFVHVYPIPAKGALTVETNLDLGGATFNVVNMMGEELLLSAHVSALSTLVDVAGLTEGTYVLVVKKDDYVLTKKIVILK